MTGQVAQNGQDYSFAGLYAGTLDNSFLPTNGRYYFIPVLPKYFNNPGAIFKSVIAPKDFSVGAKLSSLNAKIEYFNSKYPESYSGTGWITKVGNSIYMMNPFENRSSSASFEGFKPETDFITEMSGTLSGQTFAYANISSGSLKIFVSNYRSDLYNYKDKLPESYFAREPYPVWRDTHLTEYMKVSAENPDQTTHRLTTFKMKGFMTKPALSVLNKPSETYTVISDEYINGIYTITLDHNGPVLLSIKP